MLSGLPPITDPNVLVGVKTADDGAVYRLSDELAMIQTVDFFTPIVDDPYAFGAIAAANSISDVYAMGGRPVLALNIVGFPRKSETAPLSVLKEILRGGADKAREAGIEIAGGHTINDAEPKYGLCVTGLVHPDKIWCNIGGRAGDQLILTKPLGTGIITTALRDGKAADGVRDAAVDSMMALNRRSAEIAAQVEVHACTDVTGFGLLGHLREMIGEDLGARVSLAAIPVLEGTRALASQGSVPGGTKRNKASLDGVAIFAAVIDEVDRLVLCDAQTSGGLLLAIPPESVQGLLDQLHAAGVAAAAVGELIDKPAGKIEVIP